MDEIFKKFNNLKVLVVGDVILDKYYFTDVNRISPEAPIPVAKFKKETKILGGAANVALNLKNLGLETTILSKLGKDKDAETIKNLLDNNKINYNFFNVGTNTISKIRVISKNHQIVRLDYEDTDVYFKEKNEDLINWILENYKNFDLIIFSDYVKGVITEDLIEKVKDLDIYKSIDSKRIYALEGFSLYKPNLKEAIEAAKNLGFNEKIENKNEDVKKLGEFLANKLKVNLLITRNKEGATFIDENNNKIFHSKSRVEKLTDVTGAGDTCISIFSVLNYLNYDPKKSLKLMNTAAKITVSNLGTYAPTVEEIERELILSKLDKKIYYNIDEDNFIEKLVKNLKSQNKKIVFTNGCFDILHKGHVDYLNEAKKYGDVLIVGLNSDNSVKKLKGKNRPINSEDFRSFLLSNLKSVDYVIIFDEDTPENLISKIKPDIHVKGGDYNIEDLPEAKIVNEYGGEVKIIPFKYDISTTKIIEKIKNSKN